MFRHCRHLHGSYTKISLKHTAINTNIIIYIIAKKFYMSIKSILYILQNGIQFGSRIDIRAYAITVTDSYTYFSDTNKQTVLSLC
jgi:hypothetical protein